MNREVVIPGGAGIYPLQGDVESTAGNQNVTVVGWQGTPIAPNTNESGSIYQFDQSVNEWVPILRASIQVNGISVSDDPLISVNVAKPILVNGS